MFKKLNKKGFTLAELLIVVAIIGVLVAVSIPIFTAQLKKAKLATNQANARAAYAEVAANMLDQGETNAKATYSVGTAQLKSNVTAQSTSVKANGPIQSWSVGTNLSTSKALGDETAKGWEVAIDDKGNVKYTPKWS